MRIVRQSSFVAVPWKNGGGITREAIRVPASGDPFRWRLSLARIDASGPFSDFAGYRRFMVLLQGAGVSLKFPGRDGAAGSGGPAPRAHETPRAHELRSIGDLAEFDGGPAPHCDLADGPCVDLNLMVSKTLPGVCVSVQPLTGELYARSLGGGESMLVFPIDSSVELQAGGGPEVLEAWDLALLSGAEHREVRISAHGRGGSAGAAMLFLAILPGGVPPAA